MQKFLLLCSALLGLCVGCNRSGMIDATAPAPSASNAPARIGPPARIAHGSTVNLQDYVAAGKTTIFDFTSEFCPPCRAIAPHLHHLNSTRSDIVVVEVDINRPGVEGIDWGSPVAKQYGLNSIPHFKIYGPNGQLQAEGNEAYRIVAGLIQ